MKKELRLLSWNVNGIRSAVKKGFADWLAGCGADVVGIQEIRAHDHQIPTELAAVDEYELFWNAAARPGYSGTAVFSKIPPTKIQTEFGGALDSGEGRVQLLEFEKFNFLNVYFPNGKASDERLKFKLDFYDEFLALVKKLQKKKPVIFCGDVNTAHREIDLARPQANEKISGFLPDERAWLDRVVAAGFLDTFRLKNGDVENSYSWWSQRSGARQRNVGWRIDYFFASEKLRKNVAKAWIDSGQLGSDHAPVGLHLKI